MRAEFLMGFPVRWWFGPMANRIVARPSPRSFDGELNRRSLLHQLKHTCAPSKTFSASKNLETDFYKSHKLKARGFLNACLLASILFFVTRVSILTWDSFGYLYYLVGACIC